MNIETTTEFLGWCAVINLAALVIGMIKLTVFGDWVTKVRAKFFKVDEEIVRQIQFRALMNYAIAFAFFNMVPYIALRITN